MKHISSRVFLTLALVSIGCILLVVVSGYLKQKKSLFPKKEIQTAVLGAAAKNFFSTPAQTLSRMLSDTFESSKDTVAQKVVEVEKTMLKSIEKQLSTMTQSQIDAVKIQICRDLGVISPVPTKAP